MKTQASSNGIRLRSHLRSGGKESNWCYAERNGRSFGCAVNLWPQDNGELFWCAGNNNEIMLKSCLMKRGEERDWWKSFPNCTGEQQCLDLSGEWTHVRGEDD